MYKYLGILAPLLLLGGCIIYDQKGKCDNCEEGQDGDQGGHQDSDGQDSDGRDTADQDTGETAADPAFLLTPDMGTVGSTFITHLSTNQPNFDWGTVTGVTLYNGVEILADEVNPTEILLTVRIPADTTATSSDLLIETTDGDAHFLPEALTILPADANGGDPSNGGTTDTGC